MSTEQMEARYEAITSVLSQELKNLEEQERRSAARYQREKGRSGLSSEKNIT